MSEMLTGRIVTASWEDGTLTDCDLEDCECPEHDRDPVPPGTYVTIRLDDPDVAIGLQRVRLALSPEGWSNDDARAAFDEADSRWGTWRGGERHEYADGCYNGFKLGAEWQKARETFISYKAIADELRDERDRAVKRAESAERRLHDIEGIAEGHVGEIAAGEPPPLFD